MTLNNYQQQAARTLAELGSEKLNVSHMILGLASEENELLDAFRSDDLVNISEELADKHWYLVNYCSMYQISYETLAKESKAYLAGVEDMYVDITYAISKLANLEKRFIAYNKEVDQVERLKWCKEIFAVLNGAYNYFDIDIKQSLQNNVDKLRIRFPEKFTEVNAIERKLLEERAALEKK